ncbi:hypothetical protein RRG08_052478 [Elysia crispata]|uniref:Uncharacterized protein n=1 Tax=Elysia crispata TaxID=231223 RepID=A0AAE1E849_9GAST|nr:hypothetical protein RRG08_052478 [Elysia crispata]
MGVGRRRFHYKKVSRLALDIRVPGVRCSDELWISEAHLEISKIKLGWFFKCRQKPTGCGGVNIFQGVTKFENPRIVIPRLDKIQALRPEVLRARDFEDWALLPLSPLTGCQLQREKNVSVYDLRRSKGMVNTTKKTT